MDSKDEGRETTCRAVPVRINPQWIQLSCRLKICGREFMAAVL